MKNKSLHIILLTLLIIPLSVFSLTISVRSFDHQNYTRLVFEGDRGFEFDFKESDKGFNINLKEEATFVKKGASFKNSAIVNNVVHNVKGQSSNFDVQLASKFKVKRNFVLERPFRVVFDLVKSTEKKADSKPLPLPSGRQQGQEVLGNENSPPPADAAPQEEEPEDEPEARVAPRQARKRGAIETICIDAGHGGSDLGAVGAQKTLEKDITLKVSKRLKQLIMSRLGLRVIMTRTNDSEVSLNNRVAIGNNQKAQLFVSVHVNASYRKSARGPETFYVSLKATDQDALRVSQQENKSFEDFDKITEDDELKMILWDMAQNEYIKESSKLAEFIQYELNILLNTRNRGVKQAPFRVLMRAAMPAVLVEVAFLSNPGEEKRLQNDGFLNEVAGAIYSGISKFIYYHNQNYK